MSSTVPSRPPRRHHRPRAVLTLTLFAPGAGATPAGPTAPLQSRAAAENYVTYVYDSLLFREVDPGGLTYWAGIVNTQGTGAFINFVVNSPEWRKVWVDAFYDSVWLNRQVDASSLDYWEEYLQRNRFDGFELLLAVSSEAYAVAGGTPAAYIEYLFQKTWLRSPTSEEASIAQEIVDDVGAGELIEELLLSDEGLASRVAIAYGGRSTGTGRRRHRLLDDFYYEPDR